MEIMKKYYFVISQGDSKVSGHAHTLMGVRHIFKKIDNADKCSVFIKFKGGNTYKNTPFIIYAR